MPTTWPRRPRLVAGNWKMNGTAAGGATLARQLASAGSPGDVVRLVCPPFTAIGAVAAALAGTGIHLGGQNLHSEPKGAFTGEIAGAMLAELGCRFVIVGHSERRHLLGEDDALVARKLRAALREGMTPIVCVGETLDERESAATEAVLARQVGAAYQGLDAAATRSTVVAYEPVWAIGTGRVATPEQARDAHQVVRSALDRAAGPGVGARVAILYGGSVNPGNSAALFAEEEVDGALVGGASLDASSFQAIAAAAVGGRSR